MKLFKQFKKSNCHLDSVKLYPPIKSRDTEELIRIAHFPEEWNPNAVVQAKAELEKRNVTLNEQLKKADQFERAVKEFNKREFEQRGIEDFGLLEMISMALFWPRTMLSDWFLKKEGYYLPYKQRLYSIGAGVIIWACFFLWMNWHFQQEDIERQNVINRQDIYEWELATFSEDELREIRISEVEEIFEIIEGAEIPAIVILNADTLTCKEVDGIKELDPVTIRNVFIERLNNPYNHSRIEVVTVR